MRLFLPGWLPSQLATFLHLLLKMDLDREGNSVNGRGKLIKERLGIAFCRKSVPSSNQERDVCVHVRAFRAERPPVGRGSSACTLLLPAV